MPPGVKMDRFGWISLFAGIHCHAATGNKSQPHQSPQLNLPPGETTSGLGLASVLLQKPQLDLRSPRGACTGQHPTPWCRAPKQPPHALHVAWQGLATGAQETCWGSSPCLASPFLRLPAVNQAKIWRPVLKGKYCFHVILPFPGGCGQAGCGEEARSFATALPIVASACRNTPVE